MSSYTHSITPQHCTVLYCTVLYCTRHWKASLPSVSHLATFSRCKRYISATITSIAKQPTLQGQKMLWQMTIVHYGTSQTNNVSLISVFHQPFSIINMHYPLGLPWQQYTLTAARYDFCTPLHLAKEARSKKEQAARSTKHEASSKWQAASSKWQATAPRVIPSTATVTEPWCLIYLETCTEWNENPNQHHSIVLTISYLASFHHRVHTGNITLSMQKAN